MDSIVTRVVIAPIVPLLLPVVVVTNFRYDGNFSIPQFDMVQLKWFLCLESSSTLIDILRTLSLDIFKVSSLEVKSIVSQAKKSENLTFLT